MNLGWLYWDPDSVAFYIPYFHHPIAWYAVFFVCGFLAGFWILVPILKQKLLEINPSSIHTAKEESVAYVDGLTWCIVVGTLVGARLGHVFFYEWPRYRANPLEIFKTWEGGLASHGGAIGVLLAVFLYYLYRKKQYPKLTFLNLLDMLSIPVAFVAVCIRLGNFMNQEILGTPTDLPWGVIFGHPLGLNHGNTPLHPVQLYEAAAYLFTFLTLFLIWKKKGTQIHSGCLIGLFFVMIFGFRFIIEFWKEHQSLMIDESFLQTGQYLSIPFIILGFCLILYSFLNKDLKSSSSCFK